MTSDAARQPEYESLAVFAVELARRAGERIQQSLDDEIVVEYKDAGLDDRPPMDAVTNLDVEIEEELAERIRATFPTHGILGEEGTRHFPPGCEYVWAIDPIDGTQNFVNGLPIYSCSVGLLHHGAPVAGAVWGATSHRLRPGVYHAYRGGVLCFDSTEVTTARPSRGKQRGLGAMPHDEDQRVQPDATASPDRMLPWDRRHIGSGALEAAFLAAGVMESAFNTGPRSWDIAAGALLVPAGGRGIWHRVDDEWRELDAFPADPGELAEWRYPVLMATNTAYALQTARGAAAREL